MKMLLEMHDLGIRNRTHGVPVHISPKSNFLTMFHVGDQSNPNLWPPLDQKNIYGNIFSKKEKKKKKEEKKKKKPKTKTIGLRG